MNSLNRCDWLQRGYFLCCLLAVVVLASIRSHPVYGKLDFYLLDGCPWWKSWRPMIEQTLADSSTRPILSDMITDTVFRAVFAQPSPGFRNDRLFSHIRVERFEKMNRIQSRLEPVGALLLLIGNRKSGAGGKSHKSVCSEQRQYILTILTDAAREEALWRNNATSPYRCIINIHDFTPSWVPVETHHWSPDWARPSLIYTFRGKHGKEMRQLLRREPPENCTVYF